MGTLTEQVAMAADCYHANDDDAALLIMDNDGMDDSMDGSMSAPPANVVLWEEDRAVVPGVNIRAATFEALVDACVSCFDAGRCDVTDDNYNLLHVFFLMHKWFSSSEELAHRLIAVYESNQVPCLARRTKVCRAFSFWIRKFPIHFDSDKRLAEILHDFQMRLRDNGHPELADMVDLSKVPSYDWMRKMSVRVPSEKMSRKVSLVFNHLEPKELAEHLTYLEHKAMQRITFQDIKDYVQKGTMKDIPNLERSISLVNSLSQWIQCMVLSKTTPEQRAEIIVKFVAVAKNLKELQNYNTLMAVVGGLNHSSLARLSKTMACVPSETQKTLQQFSDLVLSSPNFSNYRKALLDNKDFRIPILGVHIKDLISLHVALADHVDNRLINFRKIAQMSLIFQELERLQNSTLPVEVNMDLVKTLRLSLELPYTEDEIYELSLAREPRNSVSPQSSPTKPTVFAEWAAGVCSPPDRETIERHVNAMVEAVYKNYDHDRDGCISQAEFEAIAGNFPFIDSFCVLDTDQDGMISKEEMKDYFFRANVCHALRSGFKHEFHEMTYFKPTFCAHCTGLLWGLIKQGSKCRDCGINAHKHCKDLVVMECRKWNGGSRCNSMASSDGAQVRGRFLHRRRHHKLSQGDTDSLLQPPSPRLSGSTSPCKCDSHSQADSVSLGTNCGHENIVDKLGVAEETRDKLIAENMVLQAQLEASQKQVAELRNYVGEVRQQTIDFILRQMETFKIQKDTPV